jgi:hypothetical protein
MPKYVDGDFIEALMVKNFPALDPAHAKAAAADLHHMEPCERCLTMQEEIARLRKAIEKAPHSQLCAWLQSEEVLGVVYHCDCWKKAVLEGK